MYRSFFNSGILKVILWQTFRNYIFCGRRSEIIFFVADVLKLYFMYRGTFRQVVLFARLLLFVVTMPTSALLYILGPTSLVCAEDQAVDSAVLLQVRTQASLKVQVFIQCLCSAVHAISAFLFYSCSLAFFNLEEASKQKVEEMDGE